MIIKHFAKSYHLPCMKVFCRRQGIQQCTSWRPAEFISQRIIGAFGCGQASAPRDEGLYFTTCLSHVVETLDR